MPEMNKVQDILLDWKELKSQRDILDSELCYDLSDYLMPYYGYFQDRDSNDLRQQQKKGSKIIDNTAGRSLRVLAAGMQGGLTSPARPWFRLTLPDEKLAKRHSIRLWLDEVEKRMYAAYKKSNFYQSIHAMYKEMAGFGTACMFQEMGKKALMRFLVQTWGTFWLMKDDSQRIVGMYRTMYLSAHNMVLRFGEDNVSEPVRKKAGDPAMRHQRFEVLHYVFPREDYDPQSLDPKQMPFGSIYLETGNHENKFLRESGYEEQPFMGPRWEVRGMDTYGFGPGAETIDDIKMLQEMQKTILKQVHKVLDPPMNVPESLASELNMLPGGINEVPGNSPDAIRPTYQINPDIQSAEYKVERIQTAIREGWFNDLFLMLLERPNMTATEVLERKEEKMLMLGPVIENQQFELLDPVIDRSFNMLYRAGRIPEIPVELADAIANNPELSDLKVEYLGVLAQAQKMAGVQALQSTVNFIGAMAQIRPDVLDKFNADNAFDHYIDSVGAPGVITNDEKEVAKIRQQRAQQQQMAQELAMMKEGADTGKTVAEGLEKADNISDEMKSQLMGG